MWKRSPLRQGARGVRRLSGEALESRLPLAAGPQLLTDLNPGASASFPSDPVVIGDFAYFAADNGTSGAELWKTDGTPAGTSLVKDIRPGPSGSNPDFLTNVNGTLYFRANDGTHGDELWRSDGSAEGTVLVRDIAIGDAQSGYPSNFVDVNGSLFFTASDAPSGDTKIYGPSPYLSSADSPFDLTKLGTDFWLEDFEDGLLNTPGVSASDGFVRGPGVNTDSVDADDGTIDNDGHLGHSYVINPGSVGLTFTFDRQALGGLPTYVGLVSTGGGFALPSGYFDFYDAAGNLITTLDDTVPKATTGVTSDDNFYGLFHAGGISMVRERNWGTANTLLEVDHLQYGGIVTPDATGFQLWKSDGTQAGTIPLATSLFVPDFVATGVGETLYFTGSDAVHGVELWQSDGTPAGTGIVRDINPGPGGSNPSNLTTVGSRLMFAADDGATGTELWITDGLEAGTKLVQDIHTDASSSNPHSFVNLNGSLLFAASDGTSGVELWKSDGTAAGTALLKDINPSGNSSPQAMTNVNGTLFFVAADGVNGFELWKTDGTSIGTSLVKNIHPTSHSNPNSLANINGTLLFSATTSDGYELWSSDGTLAGTFQVANISPSGNSSPTNIVILGGLALFSADDGVHGRELWVLDINKAPSFTMQGDSLVVSDEQPPVYRAANISFDGLSGHLGDGDPFTGYTESGFDVTPVTGRWMIMTTVSPTPDVFGNPPPSIWEDTNTASLEVTRAGGGDFRFDGIDFTRGTNYTLTGLRDGKAVFTQSGTVPAGPAGFVTVESSSLATIDRLQISLVRSSLETTNLDNIRLGAAVPSLTLPDWLADRSAGPPAEAGQTLTLTVTNDNNGLFLDQPTIDYLGTLTFTPAPNRSGTALVTVTLANDGGTAAGGVDRVSKTFTITVTKPHAWHNVADGLDVTQHSHIAPGDALAVINFLNAFGPQAVPASAVNGPLYYDTSGDNFVAPGDALAIINVINAGQIPSDNSPGAATFVGVDTSTQGNWSAIYGAAGYAIDAERSFLPDYVALAFTGGLTDLHDRLITTTTNDPRALLQPDGAGRILSAWTGDYGFTLDINITDGLAHQVALYVLDENTTSRNMRLDVLDATTGNLLDTQDVASFHDGKYLIWTLRGHVQIRFTNLANGLNTVLSGIFFGGPSE